MPISPFNLYPDFNILRLSHVELVVTDLARSRAYYADLLGLQVTDEDADHVYMRALEERGHHCMVLRRGEKGEVGYLGLKVFSEEDLDKAERTSATWIIRSSGSSVPIRGVLCGRTIISASRSNSTSKWTVWSRFTRNMRSITG